MKNVCLFLILVMSMTSAFANTGSSVSEESDVCKQYDWSSVQALVEPYLSDLLYTAMVMQGQSSEYRASDAASQAMDDSLPENIKTILQSIIDAGC